MIYIKKRLSNKIIYQDFIEKTKLSKEEIDILNMYIANESHVKIGMDLGLSPRSVGNRIRLLKEKYKIYRDIQESILEALLKK